MKNYCPKCRYFFGTMKAGKCPECKVPLEWGPVTRQCCKCKKEVDHNEEPDICRDCICKWFSKSQREAAGKADGKPDGQAENANVEARDQ